MKSLIVRFVGEDEGQDLIEYAMLATLIALAAFVGAQLTGTQLNAWYTNLGTTIQGWAALAVKGA